MDIKVLQLHKRASYEFKYIQDKYAINPLTRTFALADGTTQSFNSEIWAELITKEFIANPTFNPEELICNFKNQVVDYKNSNFEFSSNPAKASLEKAKKNKGGTATFIGLHFTTENIIELISCGDTNLFLLNSENKITGFPFSDVDSLDANNSFINTESLFENKIDKTFFNLKSIVCKSDDKIIIATDALSRLILKKSITLSEILKIEDFNQLKDFCLKYWENKELQEDDISAIIIPVQNSGTIKKIQPFTDFSFPKEIEEEFIPTSLPQEKQRNYPDMEINEIKNQFNAVQQDFHQVKKKLKQNELLLMIVISLLLANILLLNFFRPPNLKIETLKPEAENGKVLIDDYEDTLGNLKSEIQNLKNKLAEFNQLKENQGVETVETTKEVLKISKEEAKKRQEELIKADYKVKVDGIWGEESEKTWNEYLQKKKGKN